VRPASCSSVVVISSNAAFGATEHDAGRTEMTPIPLRHIHHQAYACWDSRKLVISTKTFWKYRSSRRSDHRFLRTDGSGHCYTFFEIGDGDTLAFFEQMSLVHPKHFNARSAFHRHVAFEVEGDATMQRFKRKLDAAGIANTLKNLGTSLSLRFKDPKRFDIGIHGQGEAFLGIRENLAVIRALIPPAVAPAPPELVASQIISREFQGFARRCHVTL